MRSRLILAVVLAAMVAAAPAVADDDDYDDDDGFAGVRTYEVTLRNVTGSQPISPPVVATHDPSVRFWQRGAAASAGVIAIAEDGDPGVAEAALSGLIGSGVTDVVNVGQPITRRGTTFMGFTDTVTFTIEAAYGDRLSFAGMLICTNDGFTGLDSVYLPDDDDRVRYYARGYDAGSEVNTEQAGDIVPPCSALGPVDIHTGGAPGLGNPDATGVITHHRGIVGESDLLAAHNWRKRVMKVTIELVDGDDD